MAHIRHLNIEITSRCDQFCIYCFNGSGVRSQKSEMSLEQWTAAMGILAVRGLESVHLTGGEPFVSPHTIPMLREAQRLGLSTSILSNGHRISALAQLHPEMFKNLAVAQISLDSMDPVVHNARRGHHQAWNQAMEAIETLDALGVPLELSCTLDETNYGDVEELQRFAKGIGATLLLRPLVASGRAHDRKSVTVMLPRTYASITHDRFHYVPTGPAFDWEVLEQYGIVTLHPDGHFRVGGLTAKEETTGKAFEVHSIQEWVQAA